MNTPKITIAIDIRLLGKKRTGDETVFFHLTKEILKLDTTNQYLLLTDERASEKIASLYAELDCIGQTNVEIVSLPATNRFIWNLIAVPSFLLQNKVDIFHTQYILPFFFPKRTKCITHIHDVSFCAYPELIGRTDRFFLWVLIPRSLRVATHIIAPSQFTKDEIIKYYGVQDNKITVVPNALGEAFIESVATDETADDLLRKKYQLPKQFILSVGTLQPRKNIPFLIDAFAHLRKKLPDVPLVLVGNKNAHHTDSAIDKSIARLDLHNQVFFPGFIDQKDMPRLMRMARVFVFPSLYEGFGIPLLEAMSQDVPVAASDIPSLREVGGEAALYFDPASVASCEEILYNLCTNDTTRETLQRAGKERVRFFSWHGSAMLLFDVYKKYSQNDAQK